MRLILREDIESLGNIGDIVEVKDGYGRNMLIPQQKAIKVTQKNIKFLEHEKQKLEDKLKKIRRESQDLAAKIEGKTLTVSKQVGEDEKLFGSVTQIDIHRILKQEGFEIDRKKILLDLPIKSLGKHPVTIKLHSQLTTEINVEVVKE